MNRRNEPKQPTRIVVLGGGFGGVYTAHHLDRLFRRDTSVEITLISRDNYFLMTPLLFEASSGELEPRHAVNPIRPMLDKAYFVEAEVERIDFGRRIVIGRHAEGDDPYEFPYDHLVLALGGVPNMDIVHGSEYGITFKTLADAIYLRNHVIDICERAEIESDPLKKRELLNFVVVGGGLVGTELMGELQEFVVDLCKTYRHIGCNEPKFYLLDHGDRIMREMPEDLAFYAQGNFKRRGIEILTVTSVDRIEEGVVHIVGGQLIPSRTILLATGVAPNPLLRDFLLEKDRKGRIVTDATMRVPGWPEVWALGDCACVPDPRGKPYPTLAQHALRQAKLLAHNISAAIRDGELKPFVYESRGMLAALGHTAGVGEIFKIKVRGFLAWWIWRTYYLLQMSRDRRVRIVLDWTIALFFDHDVVKLDLFGMQHPLGQISRRKKVGAGGKPVAEGTTEARV